MDRSKLWKWKDDDSWTAGHKGDESGMTEGWSEEQRGSKPQNESGHYPSLVRLSWQGPRPRQKWVHEFNRRRKFIAMMRTQTLLLFPDVRPTLGFKRAFFRWHQAKGCKSALIWKYSVISLKPHGRPDTTDTILYGVTAAISGTSQPWHRPHSRCGCTSEGQGAAPGPGMLLLVGYLVWKPESRGSRVRAWFWWGDEM